MANNYLGEFTSYIRDLAERHKDILHTEQDQHFVELNTDQSLSQIKNLVFPLVTIEKLTMSLSGPQDATRENRYVDIMFLDKVSSGDFDMVQEKKNFTEKLAKDFYRKIKKDRKARKLDFLKCLVISEVELNFVEVPGKNWYGVLISFVFDTPFSDDFNDEEGDPFEES